MTAFGLLVSWDTILTTGLVSLAIFYTIWNLVPGVKKLCRKVSKLKKHTPSSNQTINQTISLTPISTIGNKACIGCTKSNDKNQCCSHS